MVGALNFRTQFTEGFDESKNPREKISNFMAPAYLSFGIGTDYKPNDNFQVNIHPFTTRTTFVFDKDLQRKGIYGLKKDGDNSVFEFGAYLGARYKFKIMEGITYDNRFGVFSNYLNQPFNMDIAYWGLLDLKVNKYISAQLTLNLLYDEDQIKKTQIKQTLGIGLSYKFDNKLKENKITYQNFPKEEAIQPEIVFQESPIPQESFIP